MSETASSARPAAAGDGGRTSLSYTFKFLLGIRTPHWWSLLLQSAFLSSAESLLKPGFNPFNSIENQLPSFCRGGFPSYSTCGSWGTSLPRILRYFILPILFFSDSSLHLLLCFHHSTFMSAWNVLELKALTSMAKNSNFFLLVLAMSTESYFYLEVMQLYAVKFHLFVTCILFISREGFRRACMRADIQWWWWSLGFERTERSWLWWLNPIRVASFTYVLENNYNYNIT